MNFKLLAGLMALTLTFHIWAIDPEALGDEQIWHAWDGTMELEIRGDYLPDFGIEVFHHGQPVTTRKRIEFQVDSIEPFRLLVPYGNLEALDPDMGLVEMQTGLVLRYGDNVVDLNELQLVAGRWGDHAAFIAQDLQGRPMFTLTHMHILAEHQRDLLTVQNAEVEASPELAGLLGLDVLAGMPIGVGWLDLHMEVPPGADTSGLGPGCTERPIWPQDGEFEAEVALIAMTNIAYQGTEPGTGMVKTAPSATLKNISLADIPWIRQFTDHPDYPFEPADQHPFLVWNIYRIKDGRIEMLAESGVKHAFLTINVNCDLNCGDGNILWPGCEDTYSAGNNDTATYQGPKEEIVASLGLWDNCGSFFDPGCTGGQTGSAGQWLNRLLIDPDEFQQADAEYFMDAWYVIQYDTNIWSTMGYRPINPTPSGSGWTFNPGAYQQGPVISEWVGEGRRDPMADHQLIVVPSATPDAPYPGNMPQGHLRLLARVNEEADGRYRYNYALQNYDFERGITEFHIPLAPGATVSDTWFGGVGDMDDWSIEITADGVTFTAPEGEFQPWSTLYNFEIEVDAEPAEGEVSLELGEGAVEPRLDVGVLAPSTTSAAVLDVDRDAIGFGSVGVGSSRAEPLVLTNAGETVVSIESLALPEAPFAIDASGCGGSSFDLDVGESCVLSVIFWPGTTGAFDDELDIVANASGSPFTVALSGAGVERELSVQPDMLAFGALMVGDSVSGTLSLHNSGEAEVTISSLGHPGGPFTLDVGDCGAAPFTLEPGSSCELTVGFDPQEAGSFADAVVIESDASGSPHEVAVSGSGLPAEIFDDRFEALGLSAPAANPFVRIAVD